jgi:hypothetical protein
MSAAHGALCVVLCFLAQRRLGAARAAAAAGALALGTGPSFWWNASVAEVYTTGLAFVLATFVLLFGALTPTSRDTRTRTACIVWAAFVAGLGFAAHMFLATLGLGYLWLAWSAAGDVTDTRGARLRVMAACAAATLAGASLYLYLPLRASAHPALSYGDVEHLDRFAWLVTGGEYKRWFLRDFAWGDRSWLVMSKLAAHLGWPMTLLGLGGVGVLLARQRAVGVAAALAIAGNLWFFFAYRVADVEVFFLPGAAVLAIAAGVALSAACERLAHTSAPPRALASALPLLALAYVGARSLLTYPSVDLSHRTEARDFGRLLVATLPRDSLLLSAQTPDEWKYRTVFQDYFQRTLGLRPDVTSIATPSHRAFALALETGRPTFTYAHLRELDALATFEPDGPLFRVRARAEASR